MIGILRNVERLKRLQMHISHGSLVVWGVSPAAAYMLDQSSGISSWLNVISNYHATTSGDKAGREERTMRQTGIIISLPGKTRKTFVQTQKTHCTLSLGLIS